jgi:hypothetical protein
MFIISYNVVWLINHVVFCCSQSLLDQPDFSKLAYLGVGALGGRYCAQHRCEEVSEFDDFLEKLSNPLNGGCKTSSWDEELKVGHLDCTINTSTKQKLLLNIVNFLLT